MVKRFMAPGPWITRDLKECVLASDYDALAAENAALREERALIIQRAENAEAALVAEVAKNGRHAMRVTIAQLEARLQKVMARCADLLDEDQFNELDAIASSASVCLHQIHNGDTCEICGAKVTPVVQPERCCLDYPRCDCNSPPEPDDDWHCSQYPGCECFAGCREKALEAAP